MGVSVANLLHVGLHAFDRQPIPIVGAMFKNKTRHRQKVGRTRRREDHRCTQSLQPRCISHWLLALHNTMAA